MITKDSIVSPMQIKVQFNMAHIFTPYYMVWKLNRLALAVSSDREIDHFGDGDNGDLGVQVDAE